MAPRELGVMLQLASPLPGGAAAGSGPRSPAGRGHRGRSPGAPGCGPSHGGGCRARRGEGRGAGEAASARCYRWQCLHASASIKHARLARPQARVPEGLGQGPADAGGPQAVRQARPGSVASFRTLPHTVRRGALRRRRLRSSAGFGACIRLRCSSVTFPLQSSVPAARPPKRAPRGDLQGAILPSGRQVISAGISARLVRR